MRKTYLINKVQPDGTYRLTVVSYIEWLAAVEQNKSLPLEKRRYFILDYIADGDEADYMIMEAPYEDYVVWDRKRKMMERNWKIGRKFQHLSLDAPLAGSDGCGTLLDLVASETQVESTACDRVLLEELRAALSAWRPWANDLLEMYLRGQKRTCTKALADKYGVSPQVMRKYKRQFDEFIKKFLGGVSF